LGELRTNLTHFFNPGYLDLGLGSTWTPHKDLIVSIHPLNYNFVFSRDTFDYNSSLGCKTVINYKHKFPKASILLVTEAPDEAQAYINSETGLGDVLAFPYSLSSLIVKTDNLLNAQ